MLVLSNDDIVRLLNMEDCMAALEPMYRDYVESRALLSPRVDNIIPNSHESGYYAFKHMGGGWPAQSIQALRINSDVITHPVVAGKPRRVKQPMADGRWVGLVLLFNTDTGKLLAMFPDGVMQRMRVGAASGLALKHLAREDASTLALIGTGWQAGSQLMAARAVRNFSDVRVYSPRRESRKAFVSQYEGVRAVDSAEACVEGADVILAATSSMVRVIEPKWLKPGMHVGCIKSQEIDGEVLDRCDRVFVHNRQQAKQFNNVMPGTPNVDEAREQGWWRDPARSGRYPDLGELLSERAPGRERADEITCFANNVGLGLQFAAAGAFVLSKAREQGIGKELPDDWFTEDVHP
ncbi:MAG TPA: ornithine cyclodeaminase family protein [Burkholderiales bacterium]|nr:ornithine cyclodeaminase family protein [Burkholderiales bacterium]